MSPGRATNRENLSKRQRTTSFLHPPSLKSTDFVRLYMAAFSLFCRPCTGLCCNLSAMSRELQPCIAAALCRLPSPALGKNRENVGLLAGIVAVVVSTAICSKEVASGAPAKTANLQDSLIPTICYCGKRGQGRILCGVEKGQSRSQRGRMQVPGDGAR